MKLTFRLREYGTLALVFLLPWQARWIARFGASEWSTLSVFATEAFLAALLLLVIFERDFLRRLKEVLPRRAVIFGVLLIVWSYLSIIWSEAPDLSLQKAAMLSLVLGAIVIFFGFRHSDRLIGIFIFSMVLNSAFGFWQVFNGAFDASTWLGIASQSASGASSVVESGAGRLLRAYGTLPHPNIFGGFLALAVLLWVACFFKSKKSRVRIIILFSLSIIILALFLTFSRSAWIAAVVALIPILFALRKKVFANSMILSVIIPFIVAAIFLWPFALGRVSGQGRLETRSTIERVSSWKNGFASFAAHPILGLGSGMVAAGQGAFKTDQREPAHFLPLQAAVELGIPGLILLSALWWLILIEAKSDFFSCGIFAALTVLGVFDHYLWTTWAGNLLLAFSIFLIFRHKNAVFAGNDGS